MPPSALELLERNKAIAADNWHPYAFIDDLPKGFEPNVLVITCVDPRCDPAKFLGIKIGEAHSIRNVGGHTAHSVNDVVILDEVNHFDNILVIHHTDCGATHITNAAIHEALKARTGDKVPNVEDIDFGAISDLEQSVRDDVKFLKASPLLRKELSDSIKGYLFDIKTGQLKLIE